jgi:hypothetical protein
MEKQKINCKDLKPIEKRNAGTAYRIEGTRHSLIPTGFLSVKVLFFFMSLQLEKSKMNANILNQSLIEYSYFI